MNLFNTILDFIFPPHCLGCKKMGKYICISCTDSINCCIQHIETDCISVLRYRQTIIKDAIWFLKYKGKKPIGKDLAIFVYDGLLEELSEMSMMENFSEPILIPIPISKSKYNERGYNQTEVISRELSIIDGDRSFSYDPKILLKIKDTKSQAKMKDKIHRLKNLKGCFVIKNQEKIKNRNIILLDDITTTGATFHEATSVLKKAGAKRVLCVAVAH